MSSPYVRAAILLFALGAISSRGYALDPDKWCKLNNLSTKDYALTITDLKLVVGNIYIKKEGETGDGTKLSSAKASVALLAGTNYLWYFEATGGSFALTFAIGIGDDQTEINLKRLPRLGDRLVISPKDTVSGSPLAINLAGFRRLDAPAFLTIN